MLIRSCIHVRVHVHRKQSSNTCDRFPPCCLCSQMPKNTQHSMKNLLVTGNETYLSIVCLNWSQFGWHVLFGLTLIASAEGNGHIIVDKERQSIHLSNQYTDYFRLRSIISADISTNKTALSYCNLRNKHVNGDWWSIIIIIIRSIRAFVPLHKKQ